MVRSIRTACGFNFGFGSFLVLFCVGFICVDADCMYEANSYPEGSPVITAEPCLRCQCVRGVLLCYLRVCPHLPDPPPSGCLLLHKHKACCPELICTDLPVGNRIEARLEPDIPELPYNESMIGNGCIMNGTLYGSGSAMSSSSLCEYCYCIEGIQRCVKPRCLLPLDGCTATYVPHTCCPTSYKCSSTTERSIIGSTTTITTTTTPSTTTISTTSTQATPIPLETEDSGGGCITQGERFQEGSKVLGVGHSPCDNCYCMRGSIRCMPLSCAPPLLGCIPVVPQGECCAASYNCSGVIEVQPKLNYGNYPVVSKEYSKLRKEAQHKRRFENRHTDKHQMAASNIPHYVVAESSHSDYKNQISSTPYYFSSTPKPTTAFVSTTKQQITTTNHLPFSYKIFNPDSNKYSKISFTTTKVNGNYENFNLHRPIFDPNKIEATTQTPGEPKFDKIHRPIFNPSILEAAVLNQRFDSSKIRRPIFDPSKLDTTTMKISKIKNNRPVYDTINFEARSDVATQPKFEKIRRPVFETNKKELTTEVPFRRFENRGNNPNFKFIPLDITTDRNVKLSRPVFDPSRLEIAPQLQNYRRFDKIKVQRPIFDPSYLDTSTQRTHFTESTIQPNTQRPYKRIHLPSLEPNSLTTHSPIRLKLDYTTPRKRYDPSKLEITTPKRFDPLNRQVSLQPVDFKHRPIFDPKSTPIYNHFRTKFDEFLSPLTTTNEGLTHSSQISRRRFEETTPKPFLNFVDIDLNEIYMDGRNNRRIDDLEVSEKENISTTEITTTDFTTEETTKIFSTTFDTTTELEGSTIESTTIFELTTNLLKNATRILSTTIKALSPIDTTTVFNKLEVTSSNDTTKNETTTKIPIDSKINITTEIISNNIECIESSNSSEAVLEERIDDNTTEMTTESSTFETEITSTFLPTTLEDIELSAKTEINNNTATVNPFKKMPDNLEDMLNITKPINKKDEDYVYDYNEPTLPPSLPNLRIIPFVAADAVEEKKIATVVYPSLTQERISSHATETPLFTLNLFSPPAETQGGFVPRDPPIMKNFYENGYPSTSGLVDITAGTGVPAITNPPKSNDDNCILEGREVRHGELTSEVGACSVCLCLFGDVVCQPPKCPQLPPGCRRIQASNAPCCGRIVCNGDDESPTVVLARIDSSQNLPESATVAEGIITPDPFRDVIRTEAAPNLQSLMGDIMPFLARQTTTQRTPATTQISTTTRPINTTTHTSKIEEDSYFNFDSVLKLFFPEDKAEEKDKEKEEINPHIGKMNTTEDHLEEIFSSSSSAPMVTMKSNSTPISLGKKPPESKNSINNSPSVGLLKLAGCNIYGRMYRVGKIISELSGPCLECMCTEIGVNCKNLSC